MFLYFLLSPIFLLYSASYSLWSDVDWLFHGENHLVVIETGFVGKQLLILSFGPLGERNCRTFEDEEISKLDIKYSLLRSLFEYCTMIIFLGGGCYVAL